MQNSTSSETTRQLTDAQIRSLRRGDPLHVIAEDLQIQVATFERFSEMGGEIQDVTVRVNPSDFGLTKVHPSRVHESPSDVTTRNVRHNDESYAIELGKKIANASPKARPMMQGKYRAWLNRNRPGQVNRQDELFGLLRRSLIDESKRLNTESLEGFKQRAAKELAYNENAADALQEEMLLRFGGSAEMIVASFKQIRSTAAQIRHLGIHIAQKRV